MIRFPKSLMLEQILVWSAIGKMFMTYAFFKELSYFNYLFMVIAIIYVSLQMEVISEYLFPVVNNEDGSLIFDTDYNRENPVTRHKAIQIWSEQKMLINSNFKLLLGIFKLTNYSENDISFENISVLNYSAAYKFRRTYYSRENCEIAYSVNIQFQDQNYDVEHVQLDSLFMKSQLKSDLIYEYYLR